jgi:hypothetical protein
MSALGQFQVSVNNLTLCEAKLPARFRGAQDARFQAAGLHA